MVTPRRRVWWVDAVLVSLACLLLQQIGVEYGVPFATGAWRVDAASLVHAHAGLLFGVAMLGGDRRVLATAFAVGFLHWGWRAASQASLDPFQACAVALATGLQWRWAEVCARWAGGPFRGSRRLKVSGVGRYVFFGLLLFPGGWALVAAALERVQGEAAPGVAHILQLLLAVHVGVGALTLPFLLLWIDDRLRHARWQRWLAVLAWLCAGLVAAQVLAEAQMPALRRLVGLVYEYRALVGALLGVAVLLWRVEYSMPALTLVHLMLLHGLAAQEWLASSPQLERLLAHLVECNFMALILAMLFMLNRERKHRYHHLRAMGRHDASTGTANAHALREAWRNSADPPTVIGFLLLDQVERVLGSFGWRAQMLLLREAGRTMAPLARAYHLGNGQFALLPLGGGERDGDVSNMEEILRRLQAHVYQWRSAELRMNPYLGVAYPDRLGAEALDECLANACDAALQARGLGEHRALPYAPAQPGGSDALARRHRLAAASEALACVNARRIELYVQPIVHLGGQVAGGFKGEVLCRLRNAHGRLLAPCEFIADLEDSGHVSELDLAVVESLFQWLRARPEVMPRIAEISINLSGKSLAASPFRVRFAELLRHAPLPHSMLCFELTETAVIASQDPALRLFHELRAHGCRLALDDFGSGVQNFERLRQVPVDSLKIDGQFVRNLQTQPRDLEIVRAAVAVANAHGLTTVAEYVETAALADQLRELGVQWGQGYHFGAPEPIAALLAPDTVCALA